MRTCPQCNRAMTRDTSSGAVTFICFCGVREEGSPEDARIAGFFLNAGKTEEMYRRLILNAAYDRVNKQDKRVCPSCGLDYMTMIRVGAREIVNWICKCGYNSLHGKGAPPADETATV